MIRRKKAQTRIAPSQRKPSEAPPPRARLASLAPVWVRALRSRISSTAAVGTMMSRPRSGRARREIVAMTSLPPEERVRDLNHGGAHDRHEQRREQAKDQRKDDLDRHLLRFLLCSLAAPEPHFLGLLAQDLGDGDAQFGRPD